MRVLGGSALFAAALLAATVSVAVAQPPRAVDEREELDPEARIREAREAFEAGTRAYDAGLFEDALASFRRAYVLTGSPDLLYNIGTVADRLRLDGEALEAYEAYLSLRPEAADRANIEARVVALRRAVERREAERGEAEDATGAETGAPAAPPAAAPPLPAPEGRSGPGAVPWIVVGTGAVIAAGGVVLLGFALADIDAVENPVGEEPRWSEVQDAHARAPTLSVVGVAAIGLGAALLASGLTWAALGGAGGDEPGLEVSVGPGRLSLGGRF